MKAPHKTSFQPRRSGAGIFFATVLFAAGASAQLATGTTGIDASGNYQKERSVCTTGASHQDRATCMTEAANAQAEKRHGRIDTNGSDYAGNAMKRCEVLKGEDRAACQARVDGRGAVDGSVASGGVLRSVETVVLPPGESMVRIEPKTADPVLIAPVN
jgi:hypothetical protein